MPGCFGVEEAPEDALLAENGVLERAVEERREHASSPGNEGGIFFRFGGVGTGDGVGGEAVLGRKRRDDEARVESRESLSQRDKVRVTSPHFSVLCKCVRSVRNNRRH